MTGGEDDTPGGKPPAPKRGGGRKIAKLIEEAQPFEPPPEGAQQPDEDPALHDGSAGEGDMPLADDPRQAAHLALVPESDAQRILNLSDLDELTYDRVRKDRAKEMGVSLKTLDRLVRDKREERRKADEARARREKRDAFGSEGPPRRLPSDSPVQALGRSGDMIFFIDGDGFLQAVDYSNIKDMQLVMWFGVDYLMQHWPKYDQEGGVKTWDHTPAKEAFIETCKAKGPFNADKMVRGRGCWIAPSGTLVTHCGDVVFYGDEALDPGTIEGHIYPLHASRILPPKPGTGTEIEALWQRLQSWAWQRGSLDAYLMLGWIVAGMLGGALDWRPMTWITGDKGTGKSTLQKLVNWLFGGGSVQAVNTTAAGIYQHIGLDSVPVSVDELEAGGNNQRQQQIMELARQASSGGVMLRGGAAHQGVQFKANSAFAFTSINIPPMKGQDISRMSILELMPLTGVAEDMDPGAEARWQAVGQALRHHLIRQWPRFAATLRYYQQRMQGLGHDARGQDQFGTLLACADMALSSRAPSGTDVDEVDYAAKLDARSMKAESAALADWELLLQYLGGTFLQAYRQGSQLNVIQYVEKAVADIDDPEAKTTLRTYGMRVLIQPEVRDPLVPVQDNETREEAARAKITLQGAWLAVAFQNRQLGNLLAETDWSTLAAASQGGWVRPLLRAPGAIKTKRRITKSGSEWCVLLPVKALLGEKKEDEE